MTIFDYLIYGIIVAIGLPLVVMLWVDCFIFVKDIYDGKA